MRCVMLGVRKHGLVYRSPEVEQGEFSRPGFWATAPVWIKQAPGPWLQAFCLWSSGLQPRWSGVLIGPTPCLPPVGQDVRDPLQSLSDIIVFN